MKTNKKISNKDLAWLHAHKRSVERRDRTLKGTGVFLYCFTFVLALNATYLSRALLGLYGLGDGRNEAQTMPLTKNDLKKHVWLCTALAKGEPTEELQEKGFNYFFTSYKGEPMAYKLVMLR